MKTTFKTAQDVAKMINHLISVSVSISDNKIYKKGGRKFIYIDERLGTLFCSKSNELERLFFVEKIENCGASRSILILNQ